MKRNWLAMWKLKLAPNSNRQRRAAYRRDSRSFCPEDLESRCLLSATAGIDYHDDGSVHGLDDVGNEWYALPESVLDATTVGGGTNTGGGSPFNFADTFLLNSNPGATHTIYLDFNGHVTSGTAWNSLEQQFHRRSEFHDTSLRYRRCRWIQQQRIDGHSANLAAGC